MKIITVAKDANEFESLVGDGDFYGDIVAMKECTGTGFMFCKSGSSERKFAASLDEIAEI